MFIFYSKKSGFTLLEITIAIGLVGIFLLISSSLVAHILINNSHNREVLQATYVVQECAELVRNVRDSAWRQNLPWDCAFTPGRFSIERVVPTISSAIPDCNKDLGVRLRPVNFLTDTGGLAMVDFSAPGPEVVQANCHAAVGNRGNRKPIVISTQLTNWFAP